MKNLIAGYEDYSVTPDLVFARLPGSNGVECDPKDQSLTHLAANAFALLLSYCETL